MEGRGSESESLLHAFKRCARLLLAVGENRVELLVVEMQEGGERFFCMFFLAVGTAALGLLAAIGFSAFVVIALWDQSRVAAILILSAVYGCAALALCWRLSVLRRRAQLLPATMEELRKDRACLEKTLS